MKKFNHITDIFFDLDHTIYDFEKNSELTFIQIFNDLNLDVGPDFKEQFKIYNDIYWDKLSRKEITAEFLRYARLADTFTAINYKIADETIYKIADLFIEYLPNYNHVFDGAHDALSYLKEKYRLHIITNGPDKVQERKLKNANLTEYFHTITNSELAGVKKPDPAIFNYALKLANVSAENSLMIGDNLDADIQGALNAGIDVIWFDEYKSDKKYNFVTINKLIELKNIL